MDRAIVQPDGVPFIDIGEVPVGLERNPFDVLSLQSYADQVDQHVDVELIGDRTPTTDSEALVTGAKFHCPHQVGVAPRP